MQAQSDDDDVADEVSVPVGGQDDFMTEFFAEVSNFFLETRLPLSYPSFPITVAFQLFHAPLESAKSMRATMGRARLKKNLRNHVADDDID